MMKDLGAPVDAKEGDLGKSVGGGTVAKQPNLDETVGEQSENDVGSISALMNAALANRSIRPITWPLTTAIEKILNGLAIRMVREKKVEGKEALRTELKGKKIVLDERQFDLAYQRLTGKHRKLVFELKKANVSLRHK